MRLGSRFQDGLIVPRGEVLFHVERDPGEKQNLAAQHPERVAALARLLKQQAERDR